MGREIYIYKDLKGDEAFFAGKMNLLGDQYQRELLDYGVEECVFFMDGFKCKIDELEKKIKDRFYIINQKEQMVGHSENEEKEAIDKLNIIFNEEKINLNDMLFKLTKDMFEKRYHKSLMSLSSILKEEIEGIFEDGISSFKLYSIKGLQTNDDFYAFDYVSILKKAYACSLNDEYIILLGVGLDD